MKLKLSNIYIILLAIFLLTNGCSKSPPNKVQSTKNIPKEITKNLPQNIILSTPKEPIVSSLKVTPRFKKIIINSKVLHKAMKVNIYLPLGYNKKLKYPVLYIIHGDGCSENFCIPGLKMEITADKLIKANLIKT